jgi:hypothetical protein
MRSSTPGARSLTLEKQAVQVRFIWPTLTARVGGGALTVRGVVRPTPLADSYRVRIVYAPGDVPKAFVDSPALRPRDDGQPIPHVYPGPRPCLYLPGSGEWTNRMSIAKTIIPWLMLWLTYYELWRATGVWQGGGVEHGAAVDGSPGDEQKLEPAPPAAEQASSRTPSEP